MGLLINETRVAGGLLVVLLVVAACSGSSSSSVEADPTDSVGSIPDVVAPDVTVVMRGTKISQLVGDYDRARDEPTLNRTFARYQLGSTDLGVPFRHDGRTYLLFGDTHGAARKNGDAIAYTTDTKPEDGLALTFIHSDDGVYKPITIPAISQGAFEVPMEGVSVGGQMYIYHTTDHSSEVTMGRSVVARSEDGGRTFTYLYDLSTQHFINISIVKVSSSDWELLPGDQGEGLFIFGSGRYRRSNVYLAYQPASEIENPEAIRYFAGVDENGKPLWSGSERKARPLFEHPCVGELSVSYNTFIDRWILLYNCGGRNGIYMRTAELPWGPWSKSQIVYHPWEDDGYCHFTHVSWKYKCCDSVHDPGRANVWGGEYGPYQFAHLATGDGHSTTIYFTMSTWNPYTVVLMKAHLRK